jgi:hypothetical protein
MLPYNPYVPQNISDLMDQLGWMLLNSTKFEDDTGYFPGRNLDTAFFSLNEGIKVIRKQIGDENYRTLVALSDQMRAHFEADPEDKTEDGIKGRNCIHQIEEILRSNARRKPQE